MHNAMTTEAYLQKFPSLDPTETQYVDIGGQTPLPIKAKPAPGAKALIVLFHGAMNRDVRTYPSYLNYRSRIYPHAHQISIADTSLSLDESLTNGWFAGSTDTPLQELLPKFLRELERALKIDRLIFSGSSGGGFAALYYSWHFPSSVAVSTVPQTNINAYYKRRRDSYLEAAWKTTLPHLPEHLCTDLREIYGREMKNTVIYLQSTLDHYHVQTQMLPFLSSLSAKSQERLALKCSFWGKVGHSGAIPTEEMDAWIRAALTSPETTPEQITQTYHTANQAQWAKGEPTGISRNTPQEANSSGYTQRDTELTKHVTEYLLNSEARDNG